MISVQIANAKEKLIINADTFKVTKCHEFVYFYKGNEIVALLRMDEVRGIMKIK